MSSVLAIPALFLVLASLPFFAFPAAALGSGAGLSPATSFPTWKAPWAYRTRITIAPDSLAGPEELHDFPVAVRLTSSQQFIFDRAHSDGSDLIVTKADGTTPLPREIVGFDPGAHEAEIWFRADTLSAAKHEFFFYYGNPLANLPAADGSVWDQKYVAVYHFSENPGNGILKDFSPRGNDGTAGYKSVWTSTDVTNGILGQAWDFDGVTHFIDADAVSTPDTSFVISAWAMLTSRTTDFAFQANPGFWHVSFQINETHFRPHYAIGSPLRDLRWTPNPLPLDGRFHEFTWVFDGVADTILFYYDGIQQPATPHYLAAGARHFYTGHPINPSGTDGVGVVGPMSLNSLDIMHGPADEFRLREGTRSSAWIRTEYRNQRNPLGFLTLAPAESSGTVPVRLLSFTAVRESPVAVLRWEVVEDSEPAGRFHVVRESAPGEPMLLTAAPQREGRLYSLIDPAPPAGATTYRLSELTRTGATVYLGSAALTADATPSLRLSLPNPLRGYALIRFSTAIPGTVRLRVFDLAGREVSRLEEEILPAGDHATRWNARGDDGNPLSPGVYFIRLDAASGSLARKVLVLE